MKKRLKDKKIQILKAVYTENEIGGMFPSSLEAIHPGSLWAYVRQLSASEFYKAAAIQTSEEMLFVINWRDDIDPTTHVIKYKGRYYNIKRVDTYEGYKQDVQIYADAGSIGHPVL
ncbi:phage head closure protein [Acetobacterium sp.]|uniref:phage head closure protein n=1 Tax=Acetobacterium sp. TaxID=1872094 RepID=UPI003593F1AE